MWIRLMIFHISLRMKAIELLSLGFDLESGVKLLVFLFKIIAKKIYWNMSVKNLLNNYIKDNLNVSSLHKNTIMPWLT